MRKLLCHAGLKTTFFLNYSLSYPNCIRFRETCFPQNLKLNLFENNQQYTISVESDRSTEPERKPSCLPSSRSPIIIKSPTSKRAPQVSNELASSLLTDYFFFSWARIASRRGLPRSYDVTSGYYKISLFCLR